MSRVILNDTFLCPMHAPILTSLLSACCVTVR